MTFEDTPFAFPTATGIIHVRITADALHCLWGADTGPQTAEGLILAYREMIETIVGDKLIAGEVGEGGLVVVTGMDVEG